MAQVSFKGKGRKGWPNGKGLLFSDLATVLNWSDLPQGFGRGLDQRRAGLNAAKRVLMKWAVQLTEEFRDAYPSYGIVLRQNNSVSNSVLRWRFTTTHEGKGDVEFDDPRIGSILAGMNRTDALAWVRIEERRLEINHMVALITYELTRLRIVEKRTITTQRYRRNCRDKRA